MVRISAILFPVLLLLAVSQIVGQSRPVTSVDRRIETMNRQSREYERDNMGRASKKAKEEAAKRTRQVRLGIEEDLKALQTAYNSIVLALQSEDLRSDFAGETARTIAKHSERLKTNLALPTVEDGSETETRAQVPDRDRPALKLLGKAVYDFITNPIFEGTIDLDIKESTRASRDLDTVLFISSAISQR